MSTATDVLSVTFAGGSLVVAAWAASTAHSARRWQQDRDAERSATRVTVSFEHMVTRPERHSPLGFPAADEPPLSYVLTVIVINGGEADEYVRSVWVEQAEGRHGFDVLDDTDPHRSDLRVPPRGRVAFPVEVADLPDIRSGFYGTIRLASGCEVRSDLEHLVDDLVEDVRDGGEGL